MAGGFESGNPVTEPPADTVKAPDDAEPESIGGLFADIPLDNKEQVENFNRTAHQLKELAKNKGFSINDAGFEAYAKLCDKFISGYDSISHDLRTLTLNAPLGDFPYANDVATFNVKVANGQRDSLIENLNQMYDGYLQAREAISIARKNYDETEAEHNKRFARLSQSLDDSVESNDQITPI